MNEKSSKFKNAERSSERAADQVHFNLKYYKKTWFLLKQNIKKQGIILSEHHTDVLLSSTLNLLDGVTSLWILHAVDLKAVYDVSRVDFPVDRDAGAGGRAWFLGLQRGPLGH